MTNGDKMREIKGADSPDKQIVTWAYMNRVWLEDLPDEEDFLCMAHSIDSFLKDKPIYGDQQDAWEEFLIADYVEERTNG